VSESLAPHLAGLLAVWLLAVMSPGPAFLVITQLAAGRSRTAALAAALASALGEILFAALTLWGFAFLITQIGWLGTALRIAGAVYLVYLGLSLLRSAGAAQGETQAPKVDEALSGFRIGLLTALANFKAIAFFLSLFAVMLPPDMTSTDKLLLLASGFAIELGWYGFVAYALSAGALRRLYAKARQPIERVLGAVLVLLGIRLAVERSS
jgi:threonine/homoserine/homoserine lactone efflux protein